MTRQKETDYGEMDLDTANQLRIAQWVDFLLGLLCSHGYSVQQCPFCEDNISPIGTMTLLKVLCLHGYHTSPWRQSTLFCVLWTSRGCRHHTDKLFLLHSKRLYLDS